MRLRQAFSGFLLTVATALIALPALAEESGKAGLPQLDVRLFPEQLFWLAVSFSILYIMMAFVALPGVKKTQDSRHAIITADLKAAEEANETAKATLSGYEKALSDARANAQAMVAEITSKTLKEATERQTQQQREIHKRLHDAEMKIMTARDVALKEIKVPASELARIVIEKVAGLKVKA